jgi:hypothetical protein
VIVTTTASALRYSLIGCGHWVGSRGYQPYEPASGYVAFKLKEEAVDAGS